MSEKIGREHRQLLAVVYIRQSSPGQVKNNVESYRVQRRLVGRAKELGWSESRILVAQGDQGESASVPGQREDFESTLQRVRRGEVGMIFSNGVCRLSRNNVDWNVLLHYCAIVGVLIGDEAQVYDPSLPQDSLVLGIQGVMAVHESLALRKRMAQGLREKALRGELHQGPCPRGYLVVESKSLEKHPDRRVQRVISKVFEFFPSLTSVYALTNQLVKKGLKLPLTRGPDAGDLEWVWPSYESVRQMLQSPKYAGIYAYPMHKVVTEIDEDGQVKKRLVPVPREEWEIELLDNHPAYISVLEYEENQNKMALNASRYAPRARGAPQEGASLITGLVHCRRCGHRMAVEYRGEAISYACRKGKTRREGSCGCLRFRANEVEARLGQSILYTVRPAGVEAAEHAAELLREEWQARRQVYLDASEGARYQADLTRRRFEKVDPANTLVFETLAREYEDALQALREEESKLKIFDRDEPQLPNAEQKIQLEQLGERVERAWEHPKADPKLKKQIVRTLIEHVTADVDDQAQEIVLWVQWAGGHHTEIREPRRRRGPRPRAKDLRPLFTTLRKVSDDEAIARILNRSGIRNEKGETWTRRKVRQFRERYDIPALEVTTKRQEGWLTQEEAATYLKISPMSLNRLISSGIVPAERHPGLPSVVTQSDLDGKRVQRAVSRIRSHGNSPLPGDPDQLSLFL